MSFFGVGTNPFSTAIGQKIEKATSDAQTSDDWALYMEICDMIGRIDTGPKDAIKALKKRLSMQPKNYTSVMYSLTVLETCVKNCGRPFHVLVCNKDFLQELVKLIGPKNDPPVAVQEKVLSLIQSWAEAFRHSPDLAGVGQIYGDLKLKGVIFPVQDPECTPPILTPQRSVNAAAPEPLPVYVEHPVAVPNEAPRPLSAQNRDKLLEELNLVESNAKILSEMIDQNKPESGQGDDIQLMQDLYSTCRSMQDRIVNMMGSIGDDFITNLLRVNDDLNAIFVRYDSFMKGLQLTSERGKQTTPAKTETPCPPPTKEVQLIDLKDETPSQQLANLDLSPRIAARNLEPVSQPDTAGHLARIPDKTHGGNLASLEPQRPNEIDEMELWLSQEKKNASARGEANVGGDNGSSSEFDRFLAERAAAAETLPPSSHQQKGESSDNSPFSL